LPDRAKCEDAHARHAQIARRAEFVTVSVFQKFLLTAAPNQWLYPQRPASMKRGVRPIVTKRRARDAMDAKCRVQSLHGRTASFADG
jgi:hypothetical protein